MGFVVAENVKIDKSHTHSLQPQEVPADRHKMPLQNAVSCALLHGLKNVCGSLNHVKPD